MFRDYYSNYTYVLILKKMFNVQLFIFGTFVILAQYY